MNNYTYGYVRVSTKEQNLDRQILALREFGVPDKQIYREKLSGKDFERPVYLRLLKKSSRAIRLLSRALTDSAETMTKSWNRGE